MRLPFDILLSSSFLQQAASNKVEGFHHSDPSWKAQGRWAVETQQRFLLYTRANSSVKMNRNRWRRFKMTIGSLSSFTMFYHVLPLYISHLVFGVGIWICYSPEGWPQTFWPTLLAIVLVHCSDSSNPEERPKTKGFQRKTATTSPTLAKQPHAALRMGSQFGFQ